MRRYSLILVPLFCFSGFGCCMLLHIGFLLGLSWVLFFLWLLTLSSSDSLSIGRSVDMLKCHVKRKAGMVVFDDRAG